MSREGWETPKFRLGEKVEKARGYPFPGEVRAVLTTRAGVVRYVIEATGPDYAGMLHIFSGEQLRRKGGE